MMKIKERQLAEEEKVLVRQGKMLDALEHYLKRTGRSLTDGRAALYQWLGSRDGRVG
jgi:hypothetical protein